MPFRRPGSPYREWIQSIFWPQLDLADRLVAGVLASRSETRRRADVSVWRPIVSGTSDSTDGQKTAPHRPLPAPRGAGRSVSCLSATPFASLSSGSCLACALFEVTRGGVFWMGSRWPRQVGNVRLWLRVDRVHVRSRLVCPSRTYSTFASRSIISSVVFCRCCVASDGGGHKSLPTKAESSTRRGEALRLGRFLPLRRAPPGARPRALIEIYMHSVG